MSRVNCGRLAIVGMGYVGLPLAREATRVGWAVTGLEARSAIADQLNAGLSHVDDVSHDDVVEMLANGFSVSLDEAMLANADVVAICVPTPLSPDGGPDLAAVEEAAASIARWLRPGQLVILESTTYPGTTEDLLLPILQSGGLLVGRDFQCAFSPERVDPGNHAYGIKNTPKVVGGITSVCSNRAAEFYGTFVDEVVVARGTREAEMTKLLENTYRHVNIALVNEMAKFCHEMQIDLWDVVRCASTKPFGFSAFYPGPGVGGHCIPIDPNYLSHRVKTDLGLPFRFVELAQEINMSMPAYVVRRGQDLLNAEGLPMRDSKVLLLGVTYKEDIADQRESPATDVARGLSRLGATIMFHDPLVEQWRVDDVTLDRVADLEAAVVASDLVILLQAHRDYLQAGRLVSARLILDTRGRLKGSGVTPL